MSQGDRLLGRDDLRTLRTFAATALLRANVRRSAESLSFRAIAFAPFRSQKTAETRMAVRNSRSFAPARISGEERTLRKPRDRGR